MTKMFAMQRLTALTVIGMALGSCDGLTEALNVQMPSAGLQRVDLVESPPLNRLLAWGCYQYAPSADVACPVAGFNNRPNKANLQFSFDIVFDLLNPNGAFPIPLVEMLMGIDVFNGNNLGAVCVNFCDPETEDCTAAGDATASCSLDDAQRVDSPSDLVPNVDNLLDLATDIANDNIDNNFEFRVIPRYTEQNCQTGTCEEVGSGDDVEMCCGEECAVLETGCVIGQNDNGRTCALCDGHTEAHIQFDLDVDVMLSLFETLLQDAIDDTLAGRSVNLDIPYSADGNLFFDVPQLGTYALGFGPFESEWQLQ